MKKLTKLALVAATMTTMLTAESVFDLGAQTFYNSVTPEKQYQNASYELEKAYVSTGLAFVNGSYEPKDGHSGGMSVQLKEAKAHWGVSFSMYCYIYKDGCGVNVLGANGNAINIHLDRNYLRVNGIEVDGGDHGTNEFYLETAVDGVVSGNDDNISVVVNGHQFNFIMPNFKLAHVDINIASDGGNNTSSGIDAIHGLAITSSDE